MAPTDSRGFTDRGNGNAGNVNGVAGDRGNPRGMAEPRGATNADPGNNGGFSGGRRQATEVAPQVRQGMPNTNVYDGRRGNSGGGAPVQIAPPMRDRGNFSQPQQSPRSFSQPNYAPQRQAPMVQQMPRGNFGGGSRRESGGGGGFQRGAAPQGGGGWWSTRWRWWRRTWRGAAADAGDRISKALCCGSSRQTERAPSTR
ncbi:MAG: hypothetical protein WDO18_12290 [Acidobacteriota bacterium]